MDNAVLVGMYAAQPSAGKLGVPVLPDCAGWQAWQTPEGELFMQPVDAGGLPVGSLTVLEAGDLQKYFVPLDATFEAAAHAPLLYANDPDLLFWWLEKHLEEKRQSRRGASRDDSRVPGDYRAVVKTPAAVDPAALSFQAPGTGAPAAAVMADGAAVLVAGGAAAPQAAAVLPGFSPSAAASPGYSVAAGDLPVAAPAPPDSAEAAPAGLFLTPQEEERARILENATRAEFGILMERWRAEPSTGNATLVGDLLARPGKFGWQQKYMFSEFGLALRKEKLHALALQSHLRALELSPQDEHVLFNVARSLNELGRVDEATEHLRRALRIAPEFETARHFLQFLEGAPPA